MTTTYETIVIGGGAAGLSAALTLGRARRSVLVCDDGRHRNAVAEHMHGFLTRDGTPPKELIAIGRRELQQYPSVEFKEIHVANARRRDGGFVAGAAGGETFSARTILLATGLYDALPEVEGMTDRWGKDVFVCPYCDGWEVRDKRIAAIGKGKRGIELAQELRQWSSDLIVGLQGVNDVSSDHRQWLDVVKAPTHEAELERIADGSPGLSLFFKDGTTDRADALFLCAPLRLRYPLVDMLGCELRDDGEIAVDDRCRTNVPGVYAAGDAVTRAHQVILAAASGVRAAMAINEDLLAADIAKMLQ